MDKLGIWVSGLCAIHCLALPLLLPIAPLVASSFVAEAWFERSILTLSLLVGFSALTIGYFRYHRKTYPVYALIAGGLIYWYKDMFGEQYEPFTIAVGAGLIITAHVMNLKLCKAYKHRSNTCEEAALPAGSKF
ncbi:MerC domain-containing protein [Alteromonas facilis]|uniref:MerC domain-containing protein n=1 Tax=Alteromonas facilis TaxID=2048004 RepID=UPI000C293F7F|nr:MerC domain-containing protein [Alteromonas facilis]